jgi:SET domain-containing protein
MKQKLVLNKIVVKKSALHGYGVFALKDFRKGELIEECYALISKKGGDKFLEDFYFDCKGQYALLTGFGSIYNHSDEPNADYDISFRNKLATIRADVSIRKGEEIFVSYGDEWFTSRDLKPKSLKSRSLRCLT